jgi:HPt (histidine-containing phosphotransfer) domain-containing protein
MSTVTEVYYSPLATDPDLAELVELFVQELPERLAQLQLAFETGNLAELARFAHQLKGAGGSYGFPQLTPIAARLEMMAKQGADDAALRAALDHLIALTRRLRAGVPE